MDSRCEPIDPESPRARAPFRTADFRTLRGFELPPFRLWNFGLAGNCMDLAVIRQENLITDELASEVCDQA
jgi:hypothetical protein